MERLLIIAVAISLGVAAVNAEPQAPAAGKAEAAKSAQAAPAKKSKCDDCPMHKQAGAKKCHGSKMCPEKIQGVTTVSKDIPGGVEITMTAKDKETVARVQELSVVHYGNKDTMSAGCPGRVEGAEARLENTADGVKVYITGKTPEAVRKIQAASAAEHAAKPAAPKAAAQAMAAKKYICPMKCATSDKPGKCPKCGMPMEEVK